MAGVQALVVSEKVPSRPPVEGEQAFVTLAHDQGDRSRGKRRFDRRPHSKNQQLVLKAREVATDRLQLHATARQALMSGGQRRLQPAVAGRDQLHVGADAVDPGRRAIAHALQFGVPACRGPPSAVRAPSSAPPLGRATGSAHARASRDARGRPAGRGAPGPRKSGSWRQRRASARRRAPVAMACRPAAGHRHRTLRCAARSW